MQVIRINLLVIAMTGMVSSSVAALTAEEMEGQYEQVNDPDNACATNPATLSVTRNPDHLAFDWPVPFEIYDGSTRSGVTYDLIEERSDALVLRLEGETRRTDSGDLVIWLLRPTADRSGFCWGRTDWPLVRCESPYQRCSDAAPTS
jgi:hypothetical protein